MKKHSIILGAFLAFTVGANAQIQKDLQYWRANDQRGINVFETSKKDTIPYEGVRVRVGGDLALQFQGLSQENEADNLVELSPNFTLPTANLNLDVQIYDGVRMHLRTYLSSRHHTEAYVKGGYIQFDKLDFIKKDFLKGFMEIATVRFGMDEINYGDAHFRRTDNGAAIYNPFVGNYIMDGFTTEPFAELTLQKSNFIVVAGATNGRLNQSPVEGDDGMVFFGKLGYDNQINEDLRFRLTGSIYNSTSESTRDYLYGGDRAGARYYKILEDTAGNGSDFVPRFNPGFIYQTAFQVNPFVKWKGLEFFGVYEMTFGDQIKDVSENGQYTQYGAELLYRIGKKEKLYVGGRFNYVTGKDNDLDGTEEKNITRFNVGGGWFLTKNMMAKLEYVQQSYDGDGFVGTNYEDAMFNGVMLEAVIAF